MSDEEQQTEAQAVAETSARKQGWRPLEEFTGNPTEWRDAEKFLEYGKENNAVLRKNNEALEGSMEKLKAQMKEQGEKFDRFSQYHNESEKRMYERAVADIQARKDAAEADEDVVAYKKADNDEKALVAPVAAEPAAAQAAQPSPEFAPWVEENKWYVDDPIARQMADTYGATLQGLGLPDKQFFEEVGNYVKRTRPSVAGEQQQSRQTAVEVGGGVPQSSGTTFSDLPADAKAQCKSLVADGILSEAQYVKDYYGSSK